MSYSNSYPTQTPSLNLNFATGSDQFLDSRISYSRSSSGSAFSAERHLSSLNLLKYSTALDNAAWNGNNVPAPTTGQTDPSGGTGGCILIADTTNGSHNKFQTQVTTGDLSFTVYAKPAAGTMRMMLNLYNATNNWEVFLFDLVGGTPVAASGTSSTFSNVSATQTASGNGYYKCTIKATGSITNAIVALNPNANTSGLNAYGGISFAGDDTAGITVAFASLSTVGSSDYNATTSQIHRSFAPTLKSYSSDQPRFEYDPASDGQSVGAALGLLVESQATNLQRYGSDFASWSNKPNLIITTDAAMAPSGLLQADLVVADSSGGLTYVQDNTPVIASGTTYTGSGYVKKAGQRYIQLTGGTGTFGTSQYATFDLDDGSVDVNGGVTASAVNVGNGWWRIQATLTSTASGTGGMAIAFANSATASRLPTFSGNDYDGVLCWGWQLEAGSSASSLVNSGSLNSTISRAADSCSVALSDINFTGGGVTLVADSDTNATDDYRLAAQLIDDSQNQVSLYGNSYNNRLASILGGGESSILSQTSANGISALSFGVNDLAATRNGASPVTDTSQAFPNVSAGDLKIGGSGSTYTLNGHIKRVALYNVALSDTELQALTS